VRHKRRDTKGGTGQIIGKRAKNQIGDRSNRRPASSGVRTAVPLQEEKQGTGQISRSKKGTSQIKRGWEKCKGRERKGSDLRFKKWFLGDQFRWLGVWVDLNRRLDFAKLGAVLVILTATALKTEGLKVIESGRAAFAARDDMVDVERSKRRNHPLCCQKSA
jgi:hypothetical protein